MSSSSAESPNSNSPPPSSSTQPKSPPPRPSNNSTAPKSSPPTKAPTVPSPRSSPASSNSSKHSPPPPRKSSKSQYDHVPPPPHKSSRSSASSFSSSSSSSSNTGGFTSDQIKVIIGVSVGVGLFIVLMLICCAILFCKKKKKQPEQMQYYGGFPGGSDQYYQSSMHRPGWQNGPPMQSSPMGSSPVPMGSSPVPMGSSPGVGWHGAPPPPPMMPMSGEMSGNFSGPHRPPLPPPSPNIALGFNKSTFTYDELAAATSGFAQANLLGQGGFGYVHKGVLPSGKEIAVKSLKTGSGQGEREFQAEVEIISRVHHRHLVSLVGYCIAGGQRMLVYDFVPNNTLEHHLYGKGLPVMDWPTRLRIALGSAKGLAYLHEDCHPRIIHRDIKAANILLDYNFEAMVADFGLAKLSSDNYTHVSTRVMGTFG